MSNSSAPMNGAESLVRTLLECGVDTCFANPGTSEMHFVAALDRVPGMRCVLGLFEGVVTGAADGYARIADKPAATLLHCGPGLANGLANLHNARRANSPVINIIGDHAIHHRQYDTPLTADVEGWARPVSVWTRTATEAGAVGVGATAGATAMSMLDLGNPDLDWVQIASGMGVEAARADNMERFNELFAMANRRPGPFLIELVV